MSGPGTGSRTRFASARASAFGRREFLVLSAGAALAACRSSSSRNGGTAASTSIASRSVPSSTLGGPRLSDSPFMLGVASGDPSPTGMVLWTRLLGDLGSDSIPVAWDLADDERFERVQRSAVVQATADLGHSVHVDVDGLDPGREYFFRFRTAGHESAIGRTRTTPAPEAVTPLRFATASCQEFQEGYYAAWRDVADSTLDLVVFLGDYIYEHGVSDDGVRAHEGPTVVDLDGYRARYATYRSDPHLQAAHAACPWVVTWDDHEVSDNYADLVAGAALDGPVLDVEGFRLRRTAAYRAWYEHMPIRVAPPDDHRLAIHRTCTWGALAKFIVLDGRQYRSDQTCNPVDIGPMCDAMLRGDVTLLGEEQHRWLESELDASPTTWNLMANPTVFAPMSFTDDDTRQLDAWDGYPLVRRRVTQFLDDHGTRNPVVLSGDVHLGAAFDVHAVADDPESELVATEFVTTSISSSSDSILAANASTIRERNPHLRWIDHDHRGYLRFTVDDESLRAEYRVVAAPRDSDSPVSTAQEFTVSSGIAGVGR